MTRKKSKRAQSKKKTIKYSLDKKFNCPICNHEKVVICKINKNILKGFASCSVCEASYKCDVTKLDQGIDIYNDWLDSTK